MTMIFTKIAIAVLGAISIATTAVAIRGDSAESIGSTSATLTRSTPQLSTPLLSPRRVPALIAQPLGERRLAASLEQIWSRHPSASCLLVEEGMQVLYARKADQLVTPASALKLLTASATLRRIGPDERLITTVRTQTRPSGGIVNGDLWLVGGGDPVLGTQPWADKRTRQPPLKSSLETLADRVVAAGVKEIRGQIQGDESRYDQTRFIASWPQRYLDDNEIGPLSALTVNDGFSTWDPELVRFDNPAVGAATVFGELLQARGVIISANAGSGKAPEGSIEIARLESPKISELVADLIRESDNGTAELLVKELGVRVNGQGSTTAGLKVLVETLKEFGLNTEGTHIADGSGLDPNNKVSCSILQSIASAIEKGGPIDQGLAIAGFTGTLAKRFVDNPAKGKLRAKTGSLNHVAALVGAVDGSQGTILSFTQVINNISNSAAARDLQEALGAALARYPEIPAVEALSPLAPIDTHT